MYASAHWDLVREAHAERLRSAATGAPAEPLSLTPGRVTTWGRRPGARALAATLQSTPQASPARSAFPTPRPGGSASSAPVAGDDRSVPIPAPRGGGEVRRREAASLLDA